ncbi:hypothetical protein A2210_00360 [Candidatus Woesebacteria bacterium RIFOXYA1_FULL_40_18]|uniref:Uncharacterized protein n=2 Tax=Candidatus Woeseibacteriota TaxID=1752722 RepID=A0A0G0UTB9_9BACT|nr:MAG: hypothetical protein UU03_C0020G0003 [Candidatus Woesebacteria bacterium GW2011_GWA1_40_45]OGM75536.1 MAG: hypothetical protein A2210_00360 [Candidatus Woesebacteria bacterium RIFOXYA1_FULL_40_18]
MNKIKNYKNLLDKVNKVVQQKDLDLSADEDLSIGIMNLISIEEHLFFTSQKTGKSQYLDLLNEVRLMRTELLKRIIKDYEGEVWCISKHLLAATMRLMEVGTKELKKAAGAEPAEAEKHKKAAWNLFEKSYKLYSLFWGINLKVVDVANVAKVSKDNVSYLNEKNENKGSESVFSKLGALVQKAIDCCRE